MTLLDRAAIAAAFTLLYLGSIALYYAACGIDPLRHGRMGSYALIMAVVDAVVVGLYNR